MDTASYKYNWYGERKPLNSPGEQSYQHSRADNNNWNGTFTANYRLGRVHTLTFNHVLNVPILHCLPKKSSRMPLPKRPARISQVSLTA